jgi:hypothetical protein
MAALPATLAPKIKFRFKNSKASFLGFSASPFSRHHYNFICLFKRMKEGIPMDCLLLQQLKANVPIGTSLFRLL